MCVALCFGWEGPRFLEGIFLLDGSHGHEIETEHLDGVPDLETFPFVWLTLPERTLSQRWLMYSNGATAKMEPCPEPRQSTQKEKCHPALEQHNRRVACP